MIIQFHTPALREDRDGKIIQEALYRLRGVQDVQVDRAAQSVTVQYAEDETLEQEMRDCLAQQGFPTDDEVTTG